MRIVTYNLLNLAYLTKAEKCYEHLILSLSLYGNTLRSVKKKRINGKYFISCVFWSKSRQVENSLEYFLQGKAIEEFINLIKKDKSLSKGADILEKL